MGGGGHEDSGDEFEVVDQAETELPNAAIHLPRDAVPPAELEGVVAPKDNFPPLPRKSNASDMETTWLVVDKDENNEMTLSAQKLTQPNLGRSFASLLQSGAGANAASESVARDLAAAMQQSVSIPKADSQDKERAASVEPPEEMPALEIEESSSENEEQAQDLSISRFEDPEPRHKGSDWPQALTPENDLKAWSPAAETEKGEHAEEPGKEEVKETSSSALSQPSAIDEDAFIPVKSGLRFRGHRRHEEPQETEPAAAPVKRTAEKSPRTPKKASPPTPRKAKSSPRTSGSQIASAAESHKKTVEPVPPSSAAPAPTPSPSPSNQPASSTQRNLVVLGIFLVLFASIVLVMNCTKDAHIVTPKIVKEHRRDVRSTERLAPETQNEQRDKHRQPPTGNPVVFGPETSQKDDNKAKNPDSKQKDSKEKDKKQKNDEFKDKVMDKAEDKKTGSGKEVVKERVEIKLPKENKKKDKTREIKDSDDKKAKGSSDKENERKGDQNRQDKASELPSDRKEGKDKASKKDSPKADRKEEGKKKKDKASWDDSFDKVVASIVDRGLEFGDSVVDSATRVLEKNKLTSAADEVKKGWQRVSSFVGDPDFKTQASDFYKRLEDRLHEADRSLSQVFEHVEKKMKGETKSKHKDRHDGNHKHHREQRHGSDWEEKRAKARRQERESRENKN